MRVFSRSESSKLRLPGIFYVMPYFGVVEWSHLDLTMVINENNIDGFGKTKGTEAGGGPVSISKTN